MKAKVSQEYVQIGDLEWQPFPDAFSEGGIRWKLLHVSPEVGAWTAIFDCPKDSSFKPPHSRWTRRISFDEGQNGSSRWR